MSQRDSEKLTIDDQVFEVFMLPPKQARSMLIEMTKIIGPTLGALADVRGGLRGLLDLDLAGMSATRFQQLAMTLVDRLDPKLLDEHMRALADVTELDGVPLSKVFDLKFRGKLGTMFKWYGFALKVNYGDFFSALGSVSSLLPAPKAKE
jgi:hypothetical protein